MKVLVDGRPLRAPLAGVAQYVLNMTTELAKIPDLETHVLTFDFMGKGNDELRALALRDKGICEHRHRVAHRKVFNALSAYAPVTALPVFGLRSFDIFHLTYFERPPRVRAGQRLVTTIHDVCFLRHPELFPAANLAGSRRALQEQLDASTAILSVSEFTKAELLDLCEVDPVKIFVTPLAPVPAAPRGGDGDREQRTRPYVLYLGNLEPRKQVPTLIRAWQLSGLEADCDLLLAGAPAYLSQESLASVASARSQGVRHLGYVSESSKRRLLEGAACFVYPSSYEGFGIPVIEAMAAGVPVITCDNSALAEVSGGCARLVPTGSAEALSAAMTEVMQSASLRDRMSDAGRARAATFSWERTAAETARAYEAAL